jgi:hypothetical protein
MENFLLVMMGGLFGAALGAGLVLWANSTGINMAAWSDQEVLEFGLKVMDLVEDAVREGRCKVSERLGDNTTRPIPFQSSLLSK